MSLFRRTTPKEVDPTLRCGQGCTRCNDSAAGCPPEPVVRVEEAKLRVPVFANGEQVASPSAYSLYYGTMGSLFNVPQYTYVGWQQVIEALLAERGLEPRVERFINPHGDTEEKFFLYKTPRAGSRAPK